MLWIVNTNREDKIAEIRLDPGKIGLSPGTAIQAYDAEDGTRYPVAGGVLRVAVPKRMWRAVRLAQPRLLGKGASFLADFEREVAATEAFGGRYPLGESLPEPVSGGRYGKGAALDTQLVFSARHHVTAEHGEVSFDIRLRDGADGPLVTVGGQEVAVSKGILAVRGAVAQGSAVRIADGLWHSVSLGWAGRELWVFCDGSPVIDVRLQAPLQLPGMGHGPEIRDLRTEPATVKLGPIHATIDNLRMSAERPPAAIGVSAALR